MSGDASIDDIREAYELSHSTMNKACAVYRDGSKLSQPLMSQIVDTSILEDEDESGTIDEMVKEAVKIIPVPDDLAQPIAENLVQSFISTRKAMPDVRSSKTTKSRVGGHTVYLTSSEYEDCLLYTSPSPRDRQKSRMPSSA